MRSVLDKSDSKETAKKNSLIIGIFLVAIMIFSTVGYAFFDSSTSSAKKEKQQYKEITFTRDDYGYWDFESNGANFKSTFLPQEVENISVITTKKISDYNSKTLYFGTENAEQISTSGNREIMLTLDNYVSRTNFACLTKDCKEDYPIKSCETDEIIIFQEAGEEFSRIRQEANCIYIYYNSTQEVQSADAFLYKMLGIL